MTKHAGAAIRWAALATAVAVTLALAGCGDWPLTTGMSVGERVAQLEEELNTDDRSNLYLLFHPDTESRDQIKDEEVFDTGPLSPLYQPFNVIVDEVLTLSATQKDVTARLTTANTATGESYDLQLLMETYGEDWYIRTLELSVDPDEDPYVIRRLRG